MKTYLIEATIARLKDELQELKQQYQGHVDDADMADPAINQFEDEIKQYKTMIAALSGSFVLSKLIGFIKKRKKKKRIKKMR